MSLLNSFGSNIVFHKQRSHRIEALSDGVFAIVMTLLVLDIRVPISETNSEKDLLVSLWHTLPKLFTFILSFSLVAQFWVVLNNHFNYIHTFDRNGNIVTIFYLLFVSLLPFTTSFLSEYLWSKVAIGFYVLNILLIISMGTFHWLYCWHSGCVQAEGNKEIVVHRAIMKFARTALFSYCIVAVCCFFSSYLALSLTIFLQIIFTFVGFIGILNNRRRRSARRMPGSRQNLSV